MTRARAVGAAGSKGAGLILPKCFPATGRYRGDPREDRGDRAGGCTGAQFMSVRFLLIACVGWGREGGYFYVEFL